MKIGIVKRAESYWSLQEFTKQAISALGEKYNISIADHSEMQSADFVDRFYSKVDIVIHISSKMIDYHRHPLKPTIFLAHAWMDQAAGFGYFLKKECFSSSDAFCFTSSSAAAKFRDAFNTNIQIAKLPYFSTISMQNSYNVKSKYGLPLDRPILLYFGRLCSEKNIEGLIDIYKQVKNQQAILVIAGAFSPIKTFGYCGKETITHYEKKIRKLIKVSIKPVFLLESISRTDLMSLLAQSYLSLNPTICLEEDFGLSAVESMAVGVPVVASRWGGLKDIVRHGKTGYLFDVDLGSSRAATNNEAAAKYIDHLLSLPALRAHMSANSRIRAKRYFSKTAFVRTVSQLISKLGLKEEPLILEPKPWIKPIYEKTRVEKSADTIYDNNPNLFTRLYGHYL